jgi:predicted ATPase
VLGREFTYELIERSAARPKPVLNGALAQLIEAGLLFCRGVPPESAYLFKHALVQDAAYGTLLRARRQDLHARVAAVLEQHFADLVERQPELLALPDQCLHSAEADVRPSRGKSGFSTRDIGYL